MPGEGSKDYNPDKYALEQALKRKGRIEKRSMIKDLIR